MHLADVRTLNFTYSLTAQRTAIEIILIIDNFDLNSRYNNPLIERWIVPLDTSVNDFIRAVGGLESWTLTTVYNRGNGVFVTGIEVTQGTRAARLSVEQSGITMDGVIIWVHS
jgi:hypothetical protein